MSINDAGEVSKVVIKTVQDNFGWVSGTLAAIVGLIVFLVTIQINVQDIRQRQDKLETVIQDVKDINGRLYRIEGALGVQKK